MEIGVHTLFSHVCFLNADGVTLISPGLSYLIIVGDEYYSKMLIT